MKMEEFIVGDYYLNRSGKLVKVIREENNGELFVCEEVDTTREYSEYNFWGASGSRSDSWISDEIPEERWNSDDIVKHLTREANPEYYL